MRLVSVLLIILLIIAGLFVFLPALTLQSLEGILPDDISTQAGFFLGKTASMTLRPSTAIEVYDLLLTRHPDILELYILKADTLRDGGRYEEAIPAYDIALSHDPGNAALMHSKAKLLIKIDQMEQADILLCNILLLNTENPQYLDIIGDIALEKGDYLKAYDSYSQSLNLQPKNGLTWEKRGDVIFALLTIPTAGITAPAAFRSRDLYIEGYDSYQQAKFYSPERTSIIRDKLSNRSIEYIPRTIDDLQNRYTEYKYLPNKPNC